jgi:hypothetical protein
MSASKKPKSSILRLVRGTLDSAGEEAATVELPRESLAQVMAELSRLGMLLDDDRLWDPLDVARYFGISRNSVYAQVDAGTLPCVRVGGLLKFDPAKIRSIGRGELNNDAEGAPSEHSTERAADAMSGEMPTTRCRPQRKRKGLLMATYRGRKYDDYKVEVTVDSTLLDRRLDLRRYSFEFDTGRFSWTGTAQLALALLAHHFHRSEVGATKRTADERALRLHREFRKNVIERLEGDQFTLTTDQIAAAVAALESEGPMRIPTEGLGPINSD